MNQMLGRCKARRSHRPTRGTAIDPDPITDITDTGKQLMSVMAMSVMTRRSGSPGKPVIMRGAA